MKAYAKLFKFRAFRTYPTYLLKQHFHPKAEPTYALGSSSTAVGFLTESKPRSPFQRVRSNTPLCQARKAASSMSREKKCQLSGGRHPLVASIALAVASRRARSRISTT